MKLLNFLSTKNRIPLISECIYMVVLTLFLLYRSLKNTTFDTSYLTNMNRFFMALFCVAVAMQILTHLENRKNVVLATAILVISIMAYQHNQYIDVLMAGFLVAGCIDVKADRLIKIWTIIMATVIMAASFAGFCGIIENYTYISFREYGYRVRGALGTVFPTDSATWILFLIAYIWAAWKKITDEAMIIITLAAIALFYYYHNGQTAVLCGGILLIFIICDMFLEKKSNTVAIPNGNTDKNNAPFIQKASRLNRIIFWLITISMPMATAVLIVLAKLYGRGSGIAQKLDNIIDNRISESYTGISSYGIKLFGTNFKMYGFGQGSVDNAYKYFYLDSSYINILVRFGIAIFLIYYLTWILSAKKALKAGDIRLLLAMLLITVQSAEEHHFAALIYNPLFVMALAKYPEATELNANVVTGKRRIAAQLAVILAVGLACTMLIPGLLATTRTKYQKQQLSQNGIDTQTILNSDKTAVETILNSATAPVYTDVLPTIYYNEFNGLSKDIYYGGDHARSEKCTVLMDRECQSNLYFMRGFLYSQISDHTSVYTNDEAVSQALMAAGYHVTGFYSTRKEATVTDKKKVEKLSLQAGKYTTYWKLHLKKEPETQNESSDNESDSRLVENKNEDNESQEVYDDINMPSAPVTCTLSVTSSIANSPETVGAQIVETGEGDATTTEELASIQVLRSDFDDEGNAEIALIFTRGVDESVKLSLKNAKGYKVLIEKCEYAQTPDYDVHNTVNFYGQVIRSEYYDFDGDKAIVGPGYWAVEYDYNENKQVYRLKYYDADNNRIITAYGCWMVEYDYDELGRIITERYYDTEEHRISLPYGYAELHRSFDEYNRVIREEYYDLEGQLANNTSGFAIKENTYDEAGQVIEEKLYDADDLPLTPQ